MCVCVLTQLLSSVWLFVTPWTEAIQGPLSVEFSRQEYWSRLPFPPPQDLPNPAIKPVSLVSYALAGGFFTTMSCGKPSVQILYPFHARSSWHLFRDTRRAKKAAVSFSHTSPQVRKSYNNDSFSGFLTFFKVRLKKKKSSYQQHLLVQFVYLFILYLFCCPQNTLGNKVINFIKNIRTKKKMF